MKIEPRGEGYRVRMSREERELVRSLAAQLTTVLEAGSDDPSLERLFPTAYEDERDAEEYDRLVRPSLTSGKLDALGVLAGTVEADRLTQEELEAWLTALNDLRLVLGTRLGVTEESYDELPTDPGLVLYGWLTWLQGEVVEALADRL